MTRQTHCFALRTALVALLLLVCLSIPFADAILTEVAAGEQFTITEMIAPQTATTVQFHIGADESPLDVRVEDENGKMLYSWHALREGVFTIAASEKAHGVVLVLDNSASRFTSVRANFYVRKTTLLDKVGNSGPLDPIENKMQTISASLESLHQLQISLRNQQKDHRATVEDANERVLLWSIFQIVALVGMSGFQIFFLKRFLEKRTVL